MFLSSLAIFALLRLFGVEGAAPIVIPFNDTQYFGYDGPWQAVPIMVGRPHQQLVNLYPGGSYPSALLSNNVANYQKNFTGPGFTSLSGVYNASLPNPAVAGSSQNFAFTGPGAIIDGGWGAFRALPLSSRAGLTITDDVFHGSFGWVRNTSLTAIIDAKYDLPDGRKIPLDVGFLSLGGPSHLTIDGFIARMIPLDLSNNGVTKSNTWGLHIGSVHSKIPGSLVFGGYDMARVVGDVNAAKSPAGIGEMFINLLDISIGVAKGGSPFSFQQKDGLLRNLQNDTKMIKTRPNPTVPYLYLPENTCKSITAYLPVTFSPSLGLYLWNTDSPKYKEIISSPAYLAFIFERTGAFGNLTIYVPFFLLNLTLTSPLVDTPTPYFPCRSFDADPQSDYHLGRAFLQAAFIGMNWNNAIWWMAQAPGPQALSTSITSLENSSATITAVDGHSLWTSSWDSIWTPLAEQTTNDDSPPPPPSPKSLGLSTGIKAGIAVGAVAGGAALLGAVFLILRRHRRRSNATSANQSANTLNEPYSRSYHYQYDQQQMYNAELPYSRGGDIQRSRGPWGAMPALPTVLHEMPPVPPVLHEMPGQPTPQTSIQDQGHRGAGSRQQH